MKKTLLIIGLLIFSSSTSIFAQQPQSDLSTSQILALSKMTGACGILDSLIEFQKKTQMDGGDEFVVRFWATEAARMGLTVEQLSENCNHSIKAYEKMWKLSEEDGVKNAP